MVRCNDHEVLHKLSPLFSNDCSESGTVWGLSGKVTEHVVTYIRVWSVTPTFPLQFLGGNSVPGPSVCRGFCEFSLPMTGVIRLGEMNEMNEF